MTDQRTLVAIACAGAGAVDLLALHTASGKLEPLTRHTGLDGVAALAFGPDGTLSAACNGEPPRVVVLPADGGGEGQARKLPASTCFITLAPGGDALFSASYGEGRLDLVPLPGRPGAVHTYQTGRNTHCAVVSPDGQFLYATSLGDDRVSWFALDPSGLGEAAHDAATSPSGHVAAEQGSGPRYIRLNRAGDRAYVVHELSGEVAVYERSAETGRLSLLQHVSAVQGLDLAPGEVRSAERPDPGPHVIWAADLRLTPDERFVYVTERSTSTVAGFAVRGEGLLEFLGRIETENQPCGTAVDPSSQFLLVAGEGSHHVTAYRIDQDGALSEASGARTSSGPLWIECGPMATG
ncbi:lactonase family protein [Sinomonas notoginsengisoli]|uniref:lactonase family protein n=1 Tax=Sinomonas notoginsengisoli TaxID=1457311 RepID=UPI001F456921|nr:beta-propeller fold lactonase family protein [Sinomonas notoginsengisoli]